MPGNYNDLATEYDPPNFTSFGSINYGTNVPYYHHHQPVASHAGTPMVTFSPSVSCNNSSSTSDESLIMSMSIINERKHRRMISNRESARRSRMRKQRQLQELCTQVLRLRNENHGLMDKMNCFLVSQKQVIQENDKLKKESLELRNLLGEAQLASTYTALGDLGFFRELDDDGYNDHEVLPPSCTTAHRSAQSSHKSTIASTTSDSNV